MKNKFVILLIFIAIPLYLWDSHLFIKGFFYGKENTGSQGMKDIGRMPETSVFEVPARFSEKGRSPFIAHKENPSYVTKDNVKNRKKENLQHAPVDLPKITITGIMWNPDNPIAMLTMPDGTSAALKNNQSIGNITVKKIEKNRVLIVFENKDFWLSR
jgi:hypothetical protein